MNDLDNRYIRDANIRQSLISHLSELVLERRLELFKKVLANRTRYITVVLEDIFQAQNASAVLRTCDCLGIQDVHAIENSCDFHINTEVDMSASKWLTIHKYNEEHYNTERAINSLKKQGYRIVATSPHANDKSIKEFDVTKGKFALLFGTELTGLTKSALSLADEFVKIPMYGFIESYNISVSAALSLFEFVHKLKESSIDISISKEEAELILLNWLSSSVKNYHLIEKRFLELYYK
ncbi:MAG: TrmH family RNA methyltransferase [Bacteroidales bacterium]